MNCNDVVELSPLYLSGELDPARTAVFAAHLNSCPDCTRDFELDAHLRRAVLAEPVDTSAADLAIRHGLARDLRMRRIWVAAGVAAMLVAGTFIVRVVDRSRAEANLVCAAAAQDHLREVLNHEPRTWASQPEKVGALAARIQMSESAPAAIEGYRLEHAKLCRLNGRIFLHAVYSNGSHEFSLFLRQPDSHPSSVRVTGSGGEEVAAFETSHVAGMIVTDHASEAAHLAQSAAAAL